MGIKCFKPAFNYIDVDLDFNNDTLINEYNDFKFILTNLNITNIKNNYKNKTLNAQLLFYTNYIIININYTIDKNIIFYKNINVKLKNINQYENIKLVSLTKSLVILELLKPNKHSLLIYNRDQNKTFIYEPPKNKYIMTELKGNSILYSKIIYKLHNRQIIILLFDKITNLFDYDIIIKY
jgi:hypothetical protein